MKFKQYDIKLNKKLFEIEKDGLRVISKTISSHSEDFFEFESIGNIITIEKRRLLIPLFISIMFIGMSTLLFIGQLNGGNYGKGAIAFYYFIGFLFLSVFFFFGKNYLYLSQKNRSTHIQFLNNNPSNKKLRAFIEELQIIKKSRLIEKYGVYDEDKTYNEHRNQLKWLLDNEIISKEEYRIHLEQVERNFYPEEEGETEPIGYKQND
ncbi:hypothetical protein [uncultured Algibacter sp.]|uniref:hypothetical protein n=1 Tax=uncultured Algibacter sp. TaxID=298659 RepID=UPI0026172ED9|nr:hypothetical protein [uncultured Algibacter sp.]